MPERAGPGPEKEKDELTAHYVAGYIFDAFYGRNDALTPAIIRECEVVRRHSPKTDTEQLFVNGEIDGIPVAQTLSKTKKGDYWLTTIPGGSGRPFPQRRITPNTNNPETEKALATSLFMEQFFWLTKLLDEGK